MNLAGRFYLALTRTLRRATGQKPSTQQRLTQKFLKEWKHHQAVDGDALLAETLQHAVEEVPYYRDYFQEHPERRSNDLSQWPILSRDLLRHKFVALQADRSSGGRTWTHASGGSTGKPVAVVHDEHFAAKAQALRQLCGELFFKGPHYNKLILWGMSKEVERQKSGAETRLHRLKNRLLLHLGLKTTHINTFEYTPEKMDECVHILRTQKPEFILGYAGSVYQLAKYLKAHRIEFPKKQRKIGTTAQTLYPFMRHTIEEVFGCKVCDHYGSREVGPVAWQHDSGEMYFPQFFCHLEVVDDSGKPCAEGQPGRILVTTLHNRSMPLIRYDIGDLGVAGPTRVFNGYTFATLTRIAGKTNEEFITKDGTLVHGQYFINLFYYRPWLDEFQVIQKDYDRVEVSYVTKAGHPAVPEKDRDEIEGLVRKVLSEDTQVEWRAVSRIPRTAAGKHLYVRSDLTADHRAQAASAKLKTSQQGSVPTKLRETGILCTGLLGDALIGDWLLRVVML